VSASYLKDWRFIHAGRCQDDSYVKLNALRADNAKLEGFVGKERLNELFKIASVYVQPSLHEGFGLSVIEAMQYGCIPLVSKHGALPEVIGSFGLVLHDLDPETIACGIIEAERLFGNRREEIQNYINVNFNINRRSRQLLQIIEEIS
jgi:glycosyltransferase involved in cell wall biosynthesis